LLAPEEKEKPGIDATVRKSNIDTLENGNGVGGGELVLNELASRANIVSPQATYPSPTRPYLLSVQHILNRAPERSSAVMSAVESEFGGFTPKRKRVLVTKIKDKSSSDVLKMMVKELSFTSFDHLVLTILI